MGILWLCWLLGYVVHMPNICCFLELRQIRTPVPMSIKMIGYCVHVPKTLTPGHTDIKT